MQLNEVGIEGPTRVEFKLADLDGDGILLLNEWRNWVALSRASLDVRSALLPYQSLFWRHEIEKE